MSGAGKTFWASQLAAHGCTVFDCDALIATKLQPLAGLASDSQAEIGRWLGFPDQAGFQQREALFLACEMDILRDVMAHASACAAAHTTSVIDTGGSVIYADPALLQRLQQCSTMIYLRVHAARYQEMLHAYLEHPRPLIWQGLFQQAPDESRAAAFQRCYPQLIRHREQLYEQYSAVALEYDDYRRPTLTVEYFLQQACAAAPTRAADQLD
jgi:shikimate kinase